MLRAVAATMVVFVHFDHELIRLHQQPLGSYWLATGVDIFFVISGFIMWTSVERRGTTTAREFLKNRFIRIVPLYWLVTTLVVVVALLAPGLARTARFDSSHVVTSYLFLPARHPFSKEFWPIVVPGWSLNYEMLFYVVFATAILLSPGKSLQRLSLISLMMLSVFAAGKLLEAKFDVMHFYAEPIIFEFLIGIGLAILFNAEWLPRTYVYLALVPAGFLLLWAASHLPIWPYTTYLGASLIVGGSVLIPPLKPNLLAKLGDASYSLYLTHGAVLSALALFCERFLGPISATLFVLVGLAIAFSTAVLVYKWIELPSTTWLKQVSAPRSKQIPPQSRIDGLKSTPSS